ncbi:zinc-dependent alcohol dehydrogenase [Bacteroides caecimuris]|uniref:zinc-dependent alcohol dehydrogenase n=1 Tax=Bacteroides caecimuris TaxID=1796613 RepID=UPI00257287D1|nr:alcohol dehydrogenase catalytic domain-containing protein [Bacteroides caecimuris]
MKNRGYLLTSTGSFQLIERDLPNELPEHSVLLRIEYCGICGGDYSCYLGRRPEYPKSLGHEFVGTVLSMGGGVQAFQVGDFVISDLNYRCGKCSYCLTGNSHLCVSNNIERFSNRAFFQYMVIDETYLYRIKMPASLLYRAALIEPLSCVIHSYGQLKTLDWKTILINGCGSIGMLFCFYLKHVFRDCDISVYDVNTHRSVALSNSFGVKCVDSLSEESFDGVYECTNSPAGMEFSLRSVKRGGAFCILSHLYGEQTSFIYETICKKELRLVCSLRNGVPANVRAAIECIEALWTASLDSLIGIYAFDNLPDVFREKEQIIFNKQVMKIHTP